jgi:very-short-patch-repair endonuclease
MTAKRAQNPSPFTGEDAARSAAGEGPRIPAGAGILEPSPGRSLRSRPTSPVKGEGEDELVKRARGLRSRMTKAERKLWYALRDRRFAGFKSRRQVPVGPFITDFVCFEERLVVEVDGGQHADSPQDKRRDRWFAANEFRVLRFWNNEVLSNIEGVTTTLAEALKVEWS